MIMDFKPSIAVNIEQGGIYNRRCCFPSSAVCVTSCQRLSSNKHPGQVSYHSGFSRAYTLYFFPIKKFLQLKWRKRDHIPLPYIPKRQNTQEELCFVVSTDKVNSLKILLAGFRSFSWPVCYSHGQWKSTVQYYFTELFSQTEEDRPELTQGTWARLKLLLSGFPISFCTAVISGLPIFFLKLPARLHPYLVNFSSLADQDYPIVGLLNTQLGSSLGFV